MNEIDQQKINIIKKLLQTGTYLQKTGTKITMKSGLTQQQFVVLNEIVEKGPINQKQLVGELLLEKSNVSKIVKKLKSEELITISISSDDGRETLLKSTTNGRKSWKKIIHQLNEWSINWLAPLEKEEIENALASLEVLKQLIITSSIDEYKTS